MVPGPHSAGSWHRLHGRCPTCTDGAPRDRDLESGQNDLAASSHDLGASTSIDSTVTFAAVGSIATGIAAACALAIFIGEPINIGESVDADEQPAGEARQEEQGARYEAEVALRRGPPDVS